MFSKVSVFLDRVITSWLFLLKFVFIVKVFRGISPVSIFQGRSKDVKSRLLPSVSYLQLFLSCYIGRTKGMFKKFVFSLAREINSYFLLSAVVKAKR